MYLPYEKVSSALKGTIPDWCIPGCTVYLALSGANEPITTVYYNVVTEQWRIQVPAFEGTIADFKPFRRDKPTNVYVPHVTFDTGYVSAWRRVSKTRPTRPSIRETTCVATVRPSRPTPKDQKQRPSRPSPKTG